jgi:hypothetical protein
VGILLRLFDYALSHCSLPFMPYWRRQKNKNKKTGTSRPACGQTPVAGLSYQLPTFLVTEACSRFSRTCFMNVSPSHVPVSTDILHHILFSWLG